MSVAYLEKTHRLECILFVQSESMIDARAEVGVSHGQIRRCPHTEERGDHLPRQRYESTQSRPYLGIAECKTISTMKPRTPNVEETTA
jgi:hypothetical protein